MYPEPDPRTYIPADTRAHIGSQLAAMTQSYDDLREFMTALRTVPGTHGIRDIYVASDSITNREHGPATLNLKVIVETEMGIDQADAQSWVTGALEGYVSGKRRVTYDFTTFEKRPAGALASVVAARNHTERAREPHERPNDILLSPRADNTTWTFSS
ncbi:MAG: hypothetical protein ACMXYM_00130 [Candidatus Woesearchaeota archaeon]